MESNEAVIDGRRARGDASRRLVLAHAVDLASLEGLDQVSIGRLALAANVSKSSVATLFGNKEQLQLAAVQTAADRFTDTVILPARVRPHGVLRVAALLDRVIAYSQDRVFPGGCFFSASAADFHSKPGPVQDAIAAQLRRWLDYLAHQAGLARSAGELPGVDDPDQFAFEAQGIFEWMNMTAVLDDDLVAYRRARRAYRDRLLALGAEPRIAEALLTPGAALDV